MKGLELYNKVRTVPPEAKKPIQGGRLKGMTDINPMWRIKVLTEQFGPVGLGWYVEITKQWVEEGANEEKVAFVNINLYVKYDGEYGGDWSKPIQGTGGSSFIAKEKAGLYTSDECFKMAYTDAISVACKSLGIGANVYWDKDRSKYDNNETDTQLDATKVKTIRELAKVKGIAESSICKVKNVKKFEELSLKDWTAAMEWLKSK